MNNVLTRRHFLKASALTSGGLMLEITLSGTAHGEALGTLVGSKELNAWVQISSSGEITIYSSVPEMGQGIKTALPMIIAEEMGASWDDVTVLTADVDSARYGLQGAGGSTSIPRNFDSMRTMGASAREMLIGAASEALEVDRAELEAKDSQVIHLSGERLSFGALAALAVRQPVPDPATLSFKDPKAYTIIGTAVGGVDNLGIVLGQSKYGIDVDVPNMRYAAYARCPRLGGTAISFNEQAIRALPGVLDAFILAPDARTGQSSMSFLDGLAALQGGVAIVGEDTWSVLNAKSQLLVVWDESEASTDSWPEMKIEAQRLAGTPGGEVKRDNPVEAPLAEPNNKVLEAFYEFPYVAHVCMEPMNCTVHYSAGTTSTEARMEVWVPSQFPGQVKEIAKNLLGLSEAQVTVNMTRMGGGFGRRAVHDFVAEAMAIAARTEGPVKLTWTRTDDIHQDFFRVGGFENMKAAVSPEGKLVAWDQHYIGFAHQGKAVIGSGLWGNEFSMTALPNARVTQSLIDIKTHCGAWRAPGANTNAFVEQSFLHELSVLAGRDHVEFLIELMGERRWLSDGNINALNTGRAIDVIQLAATTAGWGKPMPAGWGQGLAFYFCHAAHIAEVADVYVDANQNFKVGKVTVAVDVGPIINMSGAISQVQGAIIDGLSTMALQQITMTNGRINQDNFDQYQVMRIGATPAIEVHFIQSDYQSTGLGEPALPPLAPAVTNAIFAATGQRIRSMPLSQEGFTLV